MNDMVWGAPWLFLGLLGVIGMWSRRHTVASLHGEVPVSHRDDPSRPSVAPLSDELRIGDREPDDGLPGADQQAEFEGWLADFFEDPRRRDHADTPDEDGDR